MDDGTGLAEKMLGPPDLVVLDVVEGVGELVVTVESTRTKGSRHGRKRELASRQRGLA